MLCGVLVGHTANAFAATEGIALVLGNANYAGFPALQGCGPSAHRVAAALRHLGFRVIEAEDATDGQMQGAAGDFTLALSHAPDAPAFIYVCSYAVNLSGRSFLLPVSAALTRPTDVLTQGLLTNSLARLLSARTEAASMLAIDLVLAPGSAEADKFTLPAADQLPPPAGLIAVSDAQLGSDASPLAQALIAGLTGPAVQNIPFLATASAQLAAAKPQATIVALHTPASMQYLAGAPPPAPAPVAAPAKPAPPPVTAQEPVPATASPAPTPVVAATPAAPPTLLPDETAMNEAQRKSVQTVLAGIGYYAGPVDGVFGPETRAAVRRYQHEIHADMTGILTGGQATLLVNRGAR